MARSLEYPYIDEIKVGDRITIHENPPLWSGRCNKKCGKNEVTYPYTLTVTDSLEADQGIAFTCGKYGWYYAKGYPITLDSSSFHKGTITVEHGSVKKADPISVGSSSPTLIYGTPSKVTSIQGTNKSPIIAGTDVGDVLRLWRETGQLVAPSASKPDAVAMFKNDTDINSVFTAMVDGLPSKFLPYEREIMENTHRHNGKLSWFEFTGDSSPDNCYGLAFIPADELEDRVADMIRDYDYEHAGWYTEKIIKRVIPMDEKSIRDMQTNNAHILGEIIHNTPDGIKILANAIVHYARHCLTEFVGNNFNWENGQAWACRINGENYFIYQTW